MELDSEGLLIKVDLDRILGHILDIDVNGQVFPLPQQAKMNGHINQSIKIIKKQLVNK